MKTRTFRQERKLQRKKIIKRCEVKYLNARSPAVLNHLVAISELSHAAWARRRKEYFRMKYSLGWAKKFRLSGGKFLP